MPDLHWVKLTIGGCDPLNRGSVAAIALNKQRQATVHALGH